MAVALGTMFAMISMFISALTRYSSGDQQTTYFITTEFQRYA